MFGRKSLVSLVVLVLWMFIVPLGVSGAGSGINGTWNVNANGYTGTLEINQSGSSFSGAIFGGPIVNGVIYNNRFINFTRVAYNQNYSGIIYTDRNGKRAIKGIFTDSDVAYDWFATASTLPPAGMDPDILGSVWDESENGWTGVWTRRDASNTFDAVWTNGGGKVTAILTMTPTGNNTVTIFRHDTSSTGGTIEVDYTAAISGDGSVSGTGTIRGSGASYPWQAKIRSIPSSHLNILGAVWNQSENGWTGVWTRRGMSNTFDAVWTNGGGRVTAVLTMTLTGGNTVSIYRRDTSSSGTQIEVDYQAVINSDGTVKGSAKIRGTGETYTWQGKIR